MTKSIYSLIPDIYSLVQTKGSWFDEQTFAVELARRLAVQFEDQKAPSLRLSKMGPTCPKALWASIHTPTEAEVLSGPTLIKFTYGHMLEALVISLAKASGHEVTGEQDVLEVDGILGHRDCVVDGNLVDVKSSTSIGMEKFRHGTIEDPKVDLFGYCDQLDGYLVGSASDVLVRNKHSGFLLAIDKQHGHLVLHEHRVNKDLIRNRIENYKRIVALSEPPGCTCGTKPHGKSGNIQLDTRASYSSFKFSCFPGLRTFIYSDGPVYLTKVMRKPDVPEVDRHGKLVYA